MKQNLKKIYQKISSSTWFITFSSFLWFLLRTGTKPTRASYPCQQIAGTNIVLFGIPVALAYWQKFKKCSRYRKKIAFYLVAVILLVVSGFKVLKLIERKTLYKNALAQSGVSRVVWISNNNATNGWAGDSSQVNAGVVENMMDQAIKALMGASSVASAWTQILPCGSNCSGKKIAIKVNFNNSWNCNENHCPVYQVVNALLRQLVEENGIDQQNIGIYDTSRSFTDYFSQGVREVFPNVRLNPDHYSWPPCTVDEGVRGAGFGCWLAEADYLINMPLLRTHSMSGATLSFKNHLGSTTNSSAFHGDFFQQSVGNNSLVQLNSHPIIRDKTILIVDDALYALKNGGPGCNGVCNSDPNFFTPNSLFISTDPVAVDSVMVDYLESQRRTGWGNNDPRITYSIAALADLGNFANSCSNGNCSFSYSNIDLIRCDSNCPSLPTAPPLQCQTCPSDRPAKDQGNANCDNNINISDFAIWKMEYIKYKQDPLSINNANSDFNCDNKLNISDFAIWKKNYI
ncbi:DUF362 domain-containing protein [Patescibacteria group bacterium]|nr:DUF362 domain-containing protein [Patescibacteria group bacterium]MCG2702282.1 DUF362 domain-containing protein [Candidatus Parcubacteria bacterium]MBU4264705.1 DUF362 domain-containing protein [Patescibacteria group bacterium]MBU4390043.1 DUF362 domain-containing protein [Patescibacteria group bacterium]MBU4396631.1 DUF362 domain-containing protein [Patescibacteria group bacterium]